MNTVHVIIRRNEVTIRRSNRPDRQCRLERITARGQQRLERTLNNREAWDSSVELDGGDVVGHWFRK